MMLPHSHAHSRVAQWANGCLMGLKNRGTERSRGGVWAHFLGCSGHAEKTLFLSSLDAKTFGLFSF